jgi:hypothetical protein
MDGVSINGVLEKRMAKRQVSNGPEGRTATTYSCLSCAPWAFAARKVRNAKPGGLNKIFPRLLIVANPRQQNGRKQNASSPPSRS